MVALVPCPGCNAHVKSFERLCPHCGHGLPTDWSTVGGTAAALLLGLSLVSCNEEPKGPKVPKPELQDIYGAPPSDDDDEKGKQLDEKKTDAKQPAPK